MFVFRYINIKKICYVDTYSYLWCTYIIRIRRIKIDIKILLLFNWIQENIQDYKNKYEKNLPSLG